MQTISDVRDRLARRRDRKRDAAHALDVFRRRTRLSYAVSIATVLAVSLLGVDEPVTAVLLLPSLALGAASVLTVWERRPPVVLYVAAVLVGIVTLLWSALTLTLPMGAAGLAMGSAVVVSRFRRFSAAGALAVWLSICALSSLAYAVDPDAAGSYLRTTALLSALLIFVFAYADRDWQLLLQFERAKNAEREVSLLNERHRFAADLHDIQGHTLHVIKLKAAVAARLQHVDPDRTAQELADVQTLVADTIARTRDLANSTHTLAFATELSNAVTLLESAGIRVIVDIDDGDTGHSHAGGHNRTFALVLREATTNILTHAMPRHVSISVTPERLRVVNDGVPAGPPRPHRGLATLADRVRDAGGRLLVRSGDELSGNEQAETERFVVEAALPASYQVGSADGVTT